MLNVKNSKDNNCWLSIYVLRTDWIETPSSIKYFLSYRVPQTDTHSPWGSASLKSPEKAPSCEHQQPLGHTQACKGSAFTNIF